MLSNPSFSKRKPSDERRSTGPRNDQRDQAGRSTQGSGAARPANGPVTNGRRWLALDADMFGKPFTLDLHHQFGWAGVATWIAFLCACKRSRTPGTFRFISEADARGQLGILGWELADDKGEEWTLEDFWLFTGRKKQTKRTRRGREMNVAATHWERWQELHAKQRHAEQMRRSRTQKRDNSVRKEPHAQRTRVRSNKDIDSDNPPTPLEGGAEALRAENPNPQNLRAGLESVRANLPAPPPPPQKRSR